MRRLLPASRAARVCLIALASTCLTATLGTTSGLAASPTTDRDATQARTTQAPPGTVAQSDRMVFPGNKPKTKPKPTPTPTPTPAPTPVPDPTPAPPTAPTKRTLEVGVQFHGVWGHYTNPDRARVLDKLVTMGATWVRIDMSWAMLQPNRGPIDPNSWGVQHIDNVITMAHDRNLKVLGTLWLTPTWARTTDNERSAPTRASDYGKAFGWAANHWRTKVDAWEAWNEPNSGDFLVGADPTTYTRLLCSAYDTLNATPATQDIPLLYGGTMYSDTPWIRRSFDAGAHHCFDVMATHPYVGPADMGPHYGNGSQIWDFGHLRAVRRLQAEYGNTKPLWLTEMGWSSHANTGNEANWAKGVTEAQQATYTRDALALLERDYPYVHKAFIYNERATQGAGAHQAGYGLMTHSMQEKPVYRALSAWLHP